MKQAIIDKGGKVGDLTTYADAIANLPSGGDNEEIIFTSSEYSTMVFSGKLNKLPFPNTILVALYYIDEDGGMYTGKTASVNNLDEEISIGYGTLGSITLVSVYAHNADVTESDILNGASYMVPVKVNILN